MLVLGAAAVVEAAVTAAAAAAEATSVVFPAVLTEVLQVPLTMSLALVPTPVRSPPVAPPAAGLLFGGGRAGAVSFLTREGWRGRVGLVVVIVVVGFCGWPLVLSGFDLGVLSAAAAAVAMAAAPIPPPAAECVSVRLMLENVLELSEGDASGYDSTLLGTF